ncbi:hypothetical protein [Sphingomonas fuzhouensis]|uniref:hypothetical protein n=1 Tax=Sphingomonas fuzhouensis TaxID=3106033 RepID=UPI002AFEB9AE|nr:hypothetical protein [Sphingomonas sp. SGZ-02]
MGLIQTIAALKASIDKSAEEETDSAWNSAVQTAGLQSQGDKGDMGIDETFVGTADGLTIRVRHTCRDTSRPFAMGPDRTRVRLEVVDGDKVLDSYTNGYES